MFGNDLADEVAKWAAKQVAVDDDDAKGWAYAWGLARKIQLRVAAAYKAAAESRPKAETAPREQATTMPRRWFSRGTWAASTVRCAARAARTRRRHG